MAALLLCLLGALASLQRAQGWADQCLPASSPSAWLSGLTEKDAKSEQSAGIYHVSHVYGHAYIGPAGHV